MNNLKLQNKILMILLLPIVTILILSFNSIYDKYEKNIKMNEKLNYLNFFLNSFLSISYSKCMIEIKSSSESKLFL